MSEARKLDRARSILGAHIIFNNHNSTVDCQIRNISKSGARLAMTAVHAMEKYNKKRAIATMCIGVGQGIAALIERV